MQLDEVKTKLNQIFHQIFEDETIQIHDAMTAKDVEEWDSLNHINLIVATEKAFNVKFTSKEVNSLKNVGEFLRLIQRKLPQA